MKHGKLWVFSTLAIVLITISILVGFRSSPSALIYQNIEALSYEESGMFGPMCSKTGTPGKYYMKWCSNCSGSFGHYDMDVVAYCVN